MKRDLQRKGVQLQQGQPCQPAAVNSQPIALWSHSNLLGSMQMAFLFNTVSLQAPSAFGICLGSRSSLLLPSNILWLFTRMPTSEVSAALFFHSVINFTPDRRHDLWAYAKSQAAIQFVKPGTEPLALITQYVHTPHPVRQQAYQHTNKLQYCFPNAVRKTKALRVQLNCPGTKMSEERASPGQHNSSFSSEHPGFGQFHLCK